MPEMRKPSGWLRRERGGGGEAGRFGRGALCGAGLLLWLDVECPLGPREEDGRLPKEPEEREEFPDEREEL